MHSWIFFALLSVILSTTYALIAKKLLTNDDDHDPIAYASSLFLVVAVLSFIAYLLVGYNAKDFAAFSDPDVLLLLAANVILYSIAPSFYWRALKYLPASEVSILYDLTNVYILVLGVSLGTEAFSITRAIGGLLIVTATILVGIQTQRKKKYTVNRYFWMLMAATILYAGAALTDNAIIANEYFSPLFFQFLNFGIPALLILALNRKSIAHLHKIYTPKVYRYILLNGLFFFGSFWAIYKAYAVGGLTSSVNFVLSIETLLTVVLASILLKEREHMLIKFICAALASIGIYLLL